MVECLFVGMGGFIGCVCRYLVGLIPYKMENGFPIKTLLINTFGAFLISLIATLVTKGKINSTNLELMLKVGICGGFTTFSTFAFESTGLINQGNYLTAALYVILSVFLGIIAVFAGQYIL